MDGLLPGLVLYGLGLSMIVAPITAAALTTAPDATRVSQPESIRPSRALTASSQSQILGLVVSLVFAARTDDPELVPFAFGQESPEFVAGSTDAFRAAMVVAAALALAGSLTAPGYSRLPKVRTAAEPAEAAFSPRSVSILPRPTIRPSSFTMSTETPSLGRDDRAARVGQAKVGK